MTRENAELVGRIVGNMDTLDILEVLDLSSETLVELLLEEILEDRESFELFLEEVA